MENGKKVAGQGQEGRPVAKEGPSGHPQNGAEKVLTPGDTQGPAPQEMAPSGGQNGKYCRFYPNCRNVNCKFIHAYPPQPQFGGPSGAPTQMQQYPPYWMPPQPSGNPLMYQPLPYYMPSYQQQQGPGGDQRFPGGNGPRRYNNNRQGGGFQGGGFHRGPPPGQQPDGADDEEEKNHPEDGQGPQMGGVCQYDQKCKKYPSCEFKHPKREFFATQPCGLYPNCNRRTCWFSHDPAKFQQGGSPGIGGGERRIPMGGGMGMGMGGRGGYNQDDDDDKCKFDPGCRKYPDCQYKHPKREHLSTLPCKLYPNCTRQVCWFSHGPAGVQQHN